MKNCKNCQFFSDPPKKKSHCRMTGKKVDPHHSCRVFKDSGNVVKHGMKCKHCNHFRGERCVHWVEFVKAQRPACSKFEARAK